MPILTLQRRLREAGRIRIGEKRTSNGKSYPAKLSTFRITARDRAVVDAAAELYGGKSKPWASPDGVDQFEVITEAAAIEVIVPPTAMAFSQFFETWTGGGCVKRCDGMRELLSDQPCLCDEENRECKPHSRLSLILPDLPAVGLFRLDTSGWNAAEELAGSVDLALQFAARGTYLPAELRLELREKRKPGEQVKKFAVPILDLKVSMREIGQAGRPLTGARLDLETGELIAIDAPGDERRGDTGDRQAPPNPPFTPVPAELAAPPAPSVAEQLATAHKQPPKAPRANAATPIPPTGLPHRAATDLQPEGSDPVDPAYPVAGSTVDAVSRDGGIADGGTSVVSGGGHEAADPERAPDAIAPPGDGSGEVPGSAASAAVVSQEDAASVARMCNEAGVPRSAFLAAFSHEQLGPVITSARALPAAQLQPLRTRLLDVFHGRTILILDGDENAARLVEVGSNQPGENVAMPADAYWKARLEYVKGVGPAKLLRMARKLAETHGVAVPSTLGEIPEHRELRRDLNVWLLELRNDAEAVA